ncbi:MAG TPA: putative PEP-binding protein, partial [Candidatus Dormibacteraeota bacterium]
RQVLEAVTDGDTVLIDGDEGILLIDPPAAARDAAKLDRTLPTDREPARTRDGKLVEVGCNVDSVHDAVRAAQAGADGVGLLRTEFLFLGRERLPTEDEQVAILEEVLRPMRGRPIVLRTLDIGADKPLPSLPQPAEANPALGVRGLRLQLHRRPDLLEDQLRAAIRLSREHILRVMFPMVSTVGELRAARKLLDQALGGTTGHERVPFQVGVMIEVPAAALAADALAAEADFFSLGTNDLVQYTFAADRTNPALAELADFLHPVILRLIGSVAAAAHKHHRWVGICGEMASNPWALPLLVGLGLDELSIHPPLVARVKQRVRGLDAGECARVAQEAAELEDGGAVRELLRRRRLGP